MTPDLVAEFIKEYTAEWNRLQSERRVNWLEHTRMLADVKRRIAGIIDAIERGIITPTTRERLETLEAEKSALERLPAEPPAPAIHPNLAERYRQAVARLQESLAHLELAAAAKSTLRTLIRTTKFSPAPSAAR